MIDIENELFTLIATQLRGKYPNIQVYSESVLVPEKFPCATVVEVSNISKDSTIDSSLEEKFANIVYEINVFTNDASGKKSNCKAILNTIDLILTRKGFSRTSVNPISLDDTTKYRMVARYGATVSADKKIYRR